MRARARACRLCCAVAKKKRREGRDRRRGRGVRDSCLTRFREKASNRNRAVGERFCDDVVVVVVVEEKRTHASGYLCPPDKLAVSDLTCAIT